MGEHPPRHRPRKAIPAAVASIPAYTVGILAPIPFVYAAVTHKMRKLWLIAAAYGAAWVATWTVLAVSPEDSRGNALSGFLLIGVAIVGTTHAFVLREVLPRKSLEPVADQPIALPPVDPTRMLCAQLQAALASLRSDVSTRSESFPPTCRQLIEETVDEMAEVLSFVAREGHADSQLRSVQAILTDYLPTSINTYLRLPQVFAVSQRNPDGRTPAEELELQLRLLRDNAKEAADSVYRGDALRLQEQSAFLQSKFGTSELDLGT